MTAWPASDTFVPDQQPVRRFVAVIASMAAVMAIVWWSGALAPRLSIVCGLDQIETGPDADTVRIGIRNDGPLPVDLTGVDIDPDVDAVSLRVHGVELPAGGARVGGGDTVVMELRFVAHDAVPATAPGPDLRGAPMLWLDLKVDTVVGFRRTADRVGITPLDGSDCQALLSPPS